MSTAYEEILQILADVELEHNIPTDTLKEIYDIEKSVIHLRVRSHIHNHLQGIVSKIAKEIDEDAA